MLEDGCIGVLGDLESLGTVSCQGGVIIVMRLEICQREKYLW